MDNTMNEDDNKKPDDVVTTIIVLNNDNEAADTLDIYFLWKKRFIKELMQIVERAFDLFYFFNLIF